MGEQPVLWHFGGTFFQQRQAKVMISGTPSTRYPDGEAQCTDDQGTRLLTLKDFFFESNFWLCLRFNANLGQKKPKSSAFLGHAASYGWDDAEQLKEWRDKKWWSIGFHMKRITRRFGGRLPIPRARDTWILRRQGLSHKILWNGYPPVIKCGSGKFHMYRCFSNL